MAAEAPMEVDKSFNIDNIEDIYYLQLNNQLVNSLDIKNKIKLCLKSCQDLNDPINIIIYSIIINHMNFN
jgi:hypothetical protein